MTVGTMIKKIKRCVRRKKDIEMMRNAIERSLSEQTSGLDNPLNRAFIMGFIQGLREQGITGREFQRQVIEMANESVPACYVGQD